MDWPFPWIIIAIGVTTLISFVLGAFVVMRLRGAKIPFSTEEQEEWGHTPMTFLQKIAWLGLVTGIAECAIIATIFIRKGGATVYWNDDDMRLQVVGVFIAGLVFHALLMSLATARADERDRKIISIAPKFQVVGLLFGLAAWHIYFGQRFRDEGAIPMVYNYLSFGSLFIVYWLTWFAGILVGSRFHRFHG